MLVKSCVVLGAFVSCCIDLRYSGFGKNINKLIQHAYTHPKLCKNARIKLGLSVFSVSTNVRGTEYIKIKLTNFP